MTTSSVPAGWYPDPGGGSGQRYFDGTQWTEHRSDVPAHEGYRGSSSRRGLTPPSLSTSAMAAVWNHTPLITP